MSTVINGSAANVTTPLVRTITSLSSGTAGVVRVLTSIPHLYGPGDYVYVHGTGLPALDGNFFFISAIVDSTHFELGGTTFTTTATGTVEDFSLTPQFQWPTSGDTTDAQLSGLISGATMLASYSQFLAFLIEFNKANTFQPVTFSNPAAATTDGHWYAATAYAQVTGAIPGPTLQASISTNPGDVVEFAISLTLGVNDASTEHTGNIRAEFIDGYTGTGPSTTAILSSEQTCTIPVRATPASANPVILGSVIVVTGGTLAIFLNGMVSVASSHFGVVEGNLQYRVYRKVK